jgi:hypothetical protein
MGGSCLKQILALSPALDNEVGEGHEPLSNPSLGLTVTGHHPQKGLVIPTIFPEN